MTVELIAKAAVLCLVAALLATVLRRTSPELTLLLAVAGCVVVLPEILGLFSEILTFLQRVMSVGLMDEGLLTPLWKILGIVIICRGSSALCRDAGESGLAEMLDTAGACSAVLVSLPLWEAAWELLEGLL